VHNLRHDRRDHGAVDKEGVEYASKPKRNGSTEAEAISTQAATWEVPVGNSAPDEEIRCRAYEIYPERGEQQGCQLAIGSRPNANSSGEGFGASRRVRQGIRDIRE
jgi:hypothetical protein